VLFQILENGEEKFEEEAESSGRSGERR